MAELRANWTNQAAGALHSTDGVSFLPRGRVICGMTRLIQGRTQEGVSNRSYSYMYTPHPVTDAT